MGYADNRPQLNELKAKLTGVDLTLYADQGYAVLQELLDASCAWVEDVASTAFNGVSTAKTLQNGPVPGYELYDGNGTNEITLRKKPVTSIIGLQVQTPILGYLRVYQPNEVKLYRKQGIVKVFTYKLAVEQAMFNTLDYQAWGTIFPPLPQAVQVQYTYGYPQYDPDLDATTYDGGATTITGDVRDPEEQNWLRNLQQAALCDAAASFLAQVVALRKGVVQSMSFDGFSQSMSPQAYGDAVQALIGKRDELLKRRRRQFFMGSIGG